MLIRATAFAVPLLASVVAGSVAGRVMPIPSTPLEVAGWWAVVLVTATIAVVATDRVARRLLPLATLMRLSMVFPDQAPSRLKVARRFAGSRAIKTELDSAHRDGVTGDRQAAAETILALVGALGEYDGRTRGHSERTQLFVTMLAQELKLRDEDRGKLMWAALVHDIGKLKVPHAVLNKPAKPTEEEWQILQSHPVQGAQICEPLREWLGPWWLAIEQHHERFDGTGYPRGLAGAEISYGARVVAVADSYEVMTAPRPYKLPMSPAAARAELTRCAGTQFDPDVVRAFLNISIGRTRRLSGPLAWLMQVLLVRPGPVVGNVLGTASGLAATTAGIFVLSQVPEVADAATRHHQAVQQVDGPSPGLPASVEDPATPRTTDSPRDEDPSTTTPAPSSATHPGSVDADDDPSSDDPSRPHSSTGSPGSPGSDDPSTTPTTRPPTTSPTSDPPTPPPPVPPPAPRPPVAVSDAVTVREDDSVTVDVLANDSIGDHGPLRLLSVGSAALGSASITPEGQVRYVPGPDRHGSDTLVYTVRDRAGRTSSASVNVTVTPVNDPPIAVSDAYSGRTAVTISVGAAAGVLANDRDIDGDKLTVTGDDSLLVTIRSDGSISFLPVLPGVTTVHYTVSDGTTTRTGTVTFTITLL
jgi:hypothetical protein